MKRNSIGLVIIMATISVLGILLIQFLFLKYSYDLKDTQFHKSTVTALQNVAKKLNDYNAKLNNHPAKPLENCNVEQLSDNYYVVSVNYVVDTNLLEHFLTVEFKKQNIENAYEYGIYDCNTRKMVYGNTINDKSINIIQQAPKKQDSARCSVEELMYENQSKKSEVKVERKKKICSMPTCEKYTYYFGVHFLNRDKYASSRLIPWYFLTGILFFVILFFGYALFIIIRQKQLSEVQKNFINNLTHEFKTPIASIDLASKVLANPKIIEQPERLAEYVKIIGQQNTRLAAHVEKLLQMASIEKVKVQLKLEKIELNLFINETIKEFRNSQNGRVYNINYKSDSNESYIFADKLHFSNLVFNILDNAIKYCTKDPEIIISLTQSFKELKLSFEDNGIGIPENYRKKIFNRFYRIPTGDVHDVKGFGLGLDYVRKISQRHGWKIEVIENNRKGSTFILKIKK